MRSPTIRLVAGLVVTLAALLLYSFFTLGQVSRLRDLQTTIIDRNRRDSLQLLRIQNNLNNLALAMRDILDEDYPYPLESFESEFQRIRVDLEDAFRSEELVAPVSRTPEQQQLLAETLSAFWAASEEMFELARSNEVKQAEQRVLTSLQPLHASLNSSVARFLVMNNETEARAASQIGAVYDSVELQIYWFLSATVAGIFVTSVYFILQNRSTLENLMAVSEQRQVLARKLITMQEEIFHSVSRELHDEFGQVLTAVGAMLRRAEKRGESEELKSLLSETGAAVQSALETVRGLSQRLHPSILDDYGLEGALAWYVQQLRDQTGVSIDLQVQSIGRPVPQPVAIHIYRIAQEAISNVIRHARSPDAWVRLYRRGSNLRLEVEDRGPGLTPEKRNGLGLIAMRERAELVNGTLEFRRPPEGGTLVFLEVSLEASGE